MLAVLCTAGALLALPAAALDLTARFPVPADPAAAQGRSTWVGICRECHANSISDAPQVRSAAAWAPRLARGREALYASALNGRSGPEGTEMPPRGGIASLSDEEVKRAVDYMLFLVLNPPTANEGTRP